MTRENLFVFLLFLIEQTEPVQIVNVRFKVDIAHALAYLGPLVLLFNCLTNQFMTANFN